MTEYKIETARIVDGDPNLGTAEIPDNAIHVTVEYDDIKVGHEARICYLVPVEGQQSK